MNKRQRRKQVRKNIDNYFSMPDILKKSSLQKYDYTDNRFTDISRAQDRLLIGGEDER